MVGLNPLDIGNGSRRPTLDADGRPADGRPVDGHPVDGHPVDGHPVDGHPVDGHHADGHHADGHSATVASLRLIRLLDDTVWLAEADGELVTARPIVAPGDRLAPDAWAQRAPAMWPDDDHRHLIAPRGTATFYGSTWMISRYQPGIRLDRLMTRALISALQAAYVAIDVTAGLAELHRAGLVHGRLREQAVVVGEDGRSRLTDWISAVPVASDSLDALRRDDLSALRALIGRLTRSADRPITRRRTADARLLTGLIGLSADRNGADLPAYLAELTALVVDSHAAQLPDIDVRAEVAAVARAAGAAEDIARSSPHPAPGTRTEGVGEPAPVRFPSTKLSQASWAKRRHRWLWPVAAATALAVAAGVVFARAPLTSLLDQVLHRNQAPAASALTHARALKPLPKLPPAHAGAIRAVTVHRLSACRPGHQCRIRLTVHAQRHAARRSVAWTIRTFDRCTGVRHARPGGTLAVRAHAAAASATRSFALPAGRALAVVVMTTSPARAAARPLLLPARASSC